MQTIHKPYIQPCISLISRALWNVWFAPQTLHKLYTKLYIQFLNTNQTNQTVEANGTNESCVTRVTNVTNVTNETGQ